MFKTHCFGKPVGVKSVVIHLNFGQQGFDWVDLGTSVDEIGSWAALGMEFWMRPFGSSQMKFREVSLLGMFFLCKGWFLTGWRFFRISMMLDVCDFCWCWWLFRMDIWCIDFCFCNVKFILGNIWSIFLKDTPFPKDFYSPTNHQRAGWVGHLKCRYCRCSRHPGWC